MDTAITEDRPRRVRPWVRALVVGCVVVGLAVSGMLAAQAGGHTRPKIPTDPKVEGASGVRLERVTLAADGGLLDVRYVVLEPTKARKWAADTSKPPTITREKTRQRFGHVAAMRNAHELRAGQSYFLIYLNTDGAVHRGDKIDITIAGTTLVGVTVE